MAGTILVPLDGSALAGRAISCAVPLARATGRVLLLARVVSVQGSGLSAEPEATPFSELRVAAEQCRAAGVVADTCLQEVRWDARVSGALCRLAIDCECDLIVMSTHGRGGL